MREGAIGEWRGSQAARIWRVERGWLESGEGGHGTRIWSWRRDSAAGEWRWRWRRNSLCFYVAITLPQMPLSKNDGVVNLFSVRRAKERHLIFGACWWDYSVRCEIKFSGGRTVSSAQQRLEFRVALVVAFFVFS